MSETPRTDAHNWHDGDYDDPLHAFFDFAKQLERELNAANQRIKRMEEALEECDWAFTKFCPEHESRYGDAWENVRDALNRPNPFKPYWQEAKP